MGEDVNKLREIANEIKEVMKKSSKRDKSRLGELAPEVHFKFDQTRLQQIGLITTRCSFATTIFIKRNTSYTIKRYSYS